MLFWKKNKDKEHEAEVLDCLHPQEWRNLAEIHDKFRENRKREAKGSAVKDLPAEQIFKILEKLSCERIAELSITQKINVATTARGERIEYPSSQLVWKASGGYGR